MSLKLCINYSHCCSLHNSLKAMSAFRCLQRDGFEINYDCLAIGG